MAGVPVRFVRLKLVDKLPVLAVTLYAPAVEFAVNTGEVAIPLASVVATLWAPANVPLAPEAGAENVTWMPARGLAELSLTTTRRGLANAVLIATLCEEPSTILIEAGCAAVIFRLKVAVPFKTGLLESVTEILTTLSPAVAGVPEITPFAGLMDKLAGRPVADHVLGSFPPAA